MKTAAMVMGAAVMAVLVGGGVGAAAAPPPPAMLGHDVRLRIPACAYGELLRWQPAQGGWLCDGSELTRIRQAYTSEVTALLSALDAMPVPPVPVCGGTDLPTACTPAVTTPYCVEHPAAPACVGTPPVSEEGCGCIAEWGAFSQLHTGGGESADTVEVPVAAGSTLIPSGRTLYYRLEGTARSDDGTAFHGWSAFACRGGRFVQYQDYPMSIESAWGLKSDALPMAYDVTASAWEQPFSVRSACGNVN